MSMTEEQFVESFVRGTAPGTLRLAWSAVELETPEGVPDLVAARARAGVPLALPEYDLRLLTNGSGRVLSLLHRCAPRKLGYLQEHTGITAEGTRKALRGLVGAGLATVTDSGRFLLAPAATLPDFDVVALEFKLRDVRRAMLQATRYQVFAHQVYVVMPPRARDGLLASADRLSALGVGAIVFDPSSGRSDTVVHARRAVPRQRHTYLDVAGRLMAVRQGSPLPSSKSGSRFPRAWAPVNPSAPPGGRAASLRDKEPEHRLADSGPESTR